MTTPPALYEPPAARLTTPGEIAAAVPLLCGFVPEESLVLLTLHGRRQRVGVTARVDLPRAGAPVQGWAGEPGRLLQRMRADGARRVVVVVCTERPSSDGHPWRDVVAAVEQAAARAHLPLTEALLVRSGRWWSYRCTDPRCCPAHGTPLARTAQVDRVAARQALDGRAVLPSRADLVRSLAPPGGDDALRARFEGARRVRADRVLARGRVAVGQEALGAWRAAVGAVLGAPARDSGPASDEELVAALDDVLVRDEVLTWVLDDTDALLALLLRLSRATPAGSDAELCALVAWVAHVRGDGALANVALDRALAADPDHVLAGTARAALDAQVPPSAVRALLAQVRATMRVDAPWTGCTGR